MVERIVDFIEVSLLYTERNCGLIWDKFVGKLESSNLFLRLGQFGLVIAWSSDFGLVFGTN
jgi:hypothetical protein